MPRVRDAASARIDPACRLEYQLLGRFEVRIDGRPVDLGAPKQRAVLAILLLEANQVVSAERLLDLLWPDGGGTMASLQSYVSNLRRSLEPDRRPREQATRLVTELPGYRMVADRSTVDLLRLDDLAAEADRRHRAGDLVGARDLAETYIASGSGQLLAELAEEPFVVVEASRVDRTRIAMLALAAQVHLDLGDPARAVALLEGPVAEYPLDERLHGILALGLYRIGRQADALRTIDRIRRSLTDDVGLELGPDLRTLQQRLLAHDPVLDHRPREAADAGRIDHASPAVPVGWPSGSPSTPLVGRGAELAVLGRALDSARAGAGRIAVVLGEAGIGKTRLIEELVHHARSNGVVTARTRCPEDGAIPPFWPAVELAEQARRAGAIPAGIVPPSEAAATTLFQLYDAVEHGLRSTSAPLLIVVDDLQWADADSLRLLAHVAGGLRAAPVLLVVSVRTADDHTTALVDCLAAFALAPDTVHIALDGLGEDAVGEWLRRRDDSVASEVVALVHERTGGHPLFLKELGELLHAEGGLGDVDAARSVRSIPPAVQFVVRRRVTRLPIETQQLLGVASVIGRTFELDIVAEVAGRTLDEALDQIAPALAVGLVSEDGDRGFRFSHALVAEALAAEMNTITRARLHAGAARALATRSGPNLGNRAQIVAHHAHLGRLAGSAELAASASAEAARRAAAGFGYEEAAAHWERSLIAQRSVRPIDRSAELDAVHELAATRFRADMVGPAKEAAIEAMDLAESVGDRANMLRSARLLGHPHLWPNQGYGEIDRTAVAALRRVLAALGADDHRGRAIVLGALSVELIYADPSELEPIQAEAEELARRADDPEVLGRVLVNVAGPLRASDLARRRGLAAEVIDLGRRGAVPDEVALVGWFHRAIAEWDDAHFDVALDHLRTARILAHRIGGGTVRAQLGWYEAATAIVRGRYDEATRSADAAEHLYRRTRRIDADVIGLVPHLAIAGDLGDTRGLVGLLVGAGATSPFGRLATDAAAWVLVESGRLDDARRLIATMDLVSPFPDDFTMLCGTSLELHLAVTVGHHAAVRAILPRLEPYLGRWTQAGSGPFSAGLVDLALARGAAMLGDDARARTMFESAVRGHAELAAPAWWARSLRHQAEFLLGTGSTDDREAARSALDQARAIAVEHRLAPLAAQVDAVAARA